MNQKTNLSTEQCNSCQATAATQTNRRDALTPFTYDEGQGVKDKIVMTGPLSQVFTQALNIIFQKKPLELVENPPEADMPVENAPAQAVTESYSQDHFMDKMVMEMGDTPELEVVLSNFDVKSVKDHVEEVKNNDVPTQPPEVTTVLVTDVNDIIKPENYENFVKDDFKGIVVVMGDMGGPGPLQSPEQEYIAAVDEDTGAAIERLFEGTSAKVCFGLEGLVKELASRTKRV